MNEVLQKIKTLTNKKTSEVIDLLEGGEMFAKQIESESGMPQPHVSNILKRLMKHGYVKVRVDGKFRYFSLTDERERVMSICKKFNEL